MTLPRFLLHAPPIRGQPSPCGRPKGRFCPGKGRWKHHCTDPPPTTQPREDGCHVCPKAVISWRRSCPLLEPPCQPGRGRGKLRATQRSSEEQTLPAALHLQSPPLLQNRPWPFIKGGEKKQPPRITHPTATPCFSLQGD